MTKIKGMNTEKNNKILSTKNYNDSSDNLSNDSSENSSNDSSDNSSNSSSDKLSNSSSDKLSNDSSDKLSNKEIDAKYKKFNSDKNIYGNKEFFEEIKKEILNKENINNSLDKIQISIKEIGKSEEINHVLLNLQNLENTLDENIKTDLQKFEYEYNKIKLNDSINFENEFLKSNLKFKNNIIKQYGEEKDKINEAEHYIDLLNKI